MGVLCASRYLEESHDENDLGGRTTAPGGPRFICNGTRGTCSARSNSDFLLGDINVALCFTAVYRSAVRTLGLRPAFERRKRTSGMEKVLGTAAASRLLAVYMIPGMGHGGAQYDNQVNEQIDALEAWIDWHQSRGSMGSLPPAMIGPYPREN